MSKAKAAAGGRASMFDAWFADEFRRTGGFTALIVLVGIDGASIVPLRSTYLHVIGDDVDWSAIVQLLTGAGVEWDGALFESLSSPAGGPVEDAAARVHLRMLEAKIGDDRLAINDGHFFDKWGRRMKVEEVAP